MNARTRIERLEREARRRSLARKGVTLRFFYGGGQEEKEAIERGEKILRFEYGRGKAGDER
jgi:hypothetical protein